jgi:hypothetical protein
MPLALPLLQQLQCRDSGFVQSYNKAVNRALLHQLIAPSLLVRTEPQSGQLHSTGVCEKDHTLRGLA